MDHITSFNEYKNNINLARNSNVAPTIIPQTTPLNQKEKGDIFVKQNQPKEIENSNKKNKFKKLVLIGTTLIASIIGIAAVKNIRYTSKIKKELLESYDKIYSDIAQNMQEKGINFEKPILEFGKLDGALGAYDNSENKIIINSKYLKKGSLCRLKNTNNVSIKTLEDNKKALVPVLPASRFKYLSKDKQRISKDEHLFNLGATLKHELTHARQNQIMLNSENALQNLYEAYKKANPEKFEKISFEDFIELQPFLKKYKPSKTMAYDQQIGVIIPFLKDKSGKNIMYQYSPEDIINAQANYSPKGANYYSNMLEIEARIGEEGFMMNYKKYMPNIALDDKVVNYYKKISGLQVKELIEPIIKSQHQN